MIFSEFLRSNDAPKLERETSFEFLDRSSHLAIARVRGLITQSLAEYPTNEVDELVARIQSRDDVAFRSATFELLLHEALRRLGYLLQPHPELPNGAPTRPDFLVEDHDGNALYLEAVLAATRDGTDRACEAMKSTTLDALSQAPHNSFRVDIDSEGDPTTQPSSRDLIRRTHDWLNSLDPDALLQLIAERGFDTVPEFVWTHEAWTVTLRPIPIRKEKRGSARALVGAFGGEGRMIDDWTPLRDAVRKKGRKYGDLDRPFVVAVNARSFSLDPIDEMQALFGQEQYVEYVDRPDIGGHLSRVPNGAWVGHSGPQSRRVSGAWFFNDLTPYTVAVRRSTLYVNPWSYHDVPQSLLRFPHARVVDGRIQRSDGLALRDIFNLPESWPE
jgi:hypothetical protein